MVDQYRVVVINLPQRTDRRREMEAGLRSIGWRADFFPAIRPDLPAGFPSVGARGCFLSHLAVLKGAQERDRGHLIVLEDDVNFGHDFTVRWPLLLALLQKQSWSICYPGHIIEGLPVGLTKVAPSTGVLCTHFMLIHRAAIPTLCNGLTAILSRSPGDPLGGPMHVDGAYSTIRAQHPNLHTFAYAPVLGQQRPSRTDIGELKWFDRLPALRSIVELARTAKSILLTGMKP